MKGSIGTSMRIVKSENVKVLPNAFEGDKCPSCKKGKLKLRKGKYGDFLGCSRFPKCKRIVKWN